MIRTSARLVDEQRQAAREYDSWLRERTISGAWMRYWFSPKRAVFLNTPVITLPKRLSLQPADRILDIGCGYAGVLIYLQKKIGFLNGAEGVDASALMVARAREEIRKRGLENAVHITEGVGTDLPFPSATFDVVLSTYVFKHLADHLLIMLLREARRVLKPGGRFCVWEAGPSRNSFLHNLNVRLISSRVSDAKFRTSQELRRFLEKAGFKNCTPFGHAPYLYYPILPRVGFVASA